MALTPSDLKYGALQERIASYKNQGLTETKAFLAWFLENIYRLDDVSVRDAICDSPNDKGIDAIYVDELDREIHFFQSKLRQSERIKGEGDLKNLSGSIAQFTTPERVRSVLDGDANAELKSRLIENNVEGLVANDYRVVGVYVTNSPIDHNAVAYVKANDDLVVYDQSAITKHYVDINQAQGIAEKFRFSFDQDPIEYAAGKTATMYLLIALAQELVKLKGITDQTLFDRNVRQDLGNTPVNKSIAKSIIGNESHNRFPLFHNGITLLAESVSVEKDTLAVENYMVVNGAQSLSTLSKYQDKITSDLKVLLRIVEVGKNESLIDQITNFSNNQNAIKPRDRRSNDKIQTRLKSEIDEKFGKKYYFIIKRGDRAPDGLEAIQNEEIGRLLLAFDLQEPWGAHQIYRIFDDEHNRIFGRPEVTAERVVFLHEVSKILGEHLEEVTDARVRSYRLTRYFLMFVLREILELSDKGQELVAHPEKFIRGKAWAKVEEMLADILPDIVVDFDTEIEDADEDFDYKSILKSEAGVGRLSKRLVNIYRKELRKERAANPDTYLS